MVKAHSRLHLNAGLVCILRSSSSELAASSGLLSMPWASIIGFRHGLSHMRILIFKKKNCVSLELGFRLYTTLLTKHEQKAELNSHVTEQSQLILKFTRGVFILGCSGK